MSPSPERHGPGEGGRSQALPVRDGAAIRPAGVIPALLTPFDEHGELDLGALATVIEFELAQGVDGLFILGTAGQGPMMLPDERRTVAHFVLERVAERVPVVVHVGAMPTRIAVELARDAARAGASAIAAIPPTYYRHDLPAIETYYASIGAAVSLPLFIYNNPTATGNPLTGGDLRALSAIPNLVGVKEASGQVATLYEALAIPGFTVLVASVDLNLLALALGAAGSVSTIAVVVPEMFVAMQSKLRAGDLAGAASDQARLSALARHLRIPAIGALHAALRFRGVDAGQPRPPLRMPTPDECSRVQDQLAAAGIASVTDGAHPRS